MVRELIDGVSRGIAAEFGDSFRIYGDEPVRQGLETPCFFIWLAERKDEPLPGPRRGCRMFLDVAYFPKEAGACREMWVAAERLLPVLEVVTLAGGSSVRGLGLRYEIIDGILHTYATYALHFLETTETERMEEARIIMKG